MTEHHDDQYHPAAEFVERFTDFVDEMKAEVVDARWYFWRGVMLGYVIGALFVFMAMLCASKAHADEPQCWPLDVIAAGAEEFGGSTAVIPVFDSLYVSKWLAAHNAPVGKSNQYLLVKYHGYTSIRAIETNNMVCNDQLRVIGFDDAGFAAFLKEIHDLAARDRRTPS